MMPISEDERGESRLHERERRRLWRHQSAKEAHLSVMLDPMLMTRIDDFAGKHNATRSEAVRWLLQQSLGTP